MMNTVVVRLNPAQFQRLKSHANVLSISANRDLQTAALTDAVKVGSELDIKGHQVSLPLQNLGRNKLQLAQLTLNWPEENGVLTDILLDGESVALSELSERKVLGGNQHALPVDLFPDDCRYVALGHLHRPQPLRGMDHIRYSGSPIPLSMRRHFAEPIRPQRLPTCWPC